MLPSPAEGCLVLAVVQRMSQASVVVDQRVVGRRQEPGSLAFVGAASEDTHPERRAPCSDTGAPLLVISQLTCYADTRKGHRVFATLNG